MTDLIERWDLAPDLGISRVLTGLWQIADMERRGSNVDLDATATAMEPYVKAGLTTFDMADHYGSAEKMVGRFLRKRGPGSIEVFTKWVPAPGPTTRTEARSAVQGALDRLESDWIDLLQFHAWNYADPSYLDALFFLQEMKDDGLIRHLGLTNVDTAHLGVIVNSGINIVANQVSFSLLDQRARFNGMIDFCCENGVSLLAFGTLGGGFLTERWLDKPAPAIGDLETWSQMKYRRYIDEVGGWDSLQDLLRVVHSVAVRHDVSMANVATRYILDQPAVGGVIVGARLGLRDHLEDNLRLFRFSLDDQGRAEIDAAAAALRPLRGDCGDEYRHPPFLTASGDLRHHIEELPPPFETTREHGRTRAHSGTIWEELAGFSRAVRHGDRILVSGTTATHLDRVIGGNDPAAQTHFAIDKIEGALHSLGGRLEDVVRTRVYIVDPDHSEEISRAHGARFGDIGPANTLVRAGLIGDDYLVEIEAEAVVDSDG